LSLQKVLIDYYEIYKWVLEMAKSDFDKIIKIFNLCNCDIKDPYYYPIRKDSDPIGHPTKTTWICDKCKKRIHESLYDNYRVDDLKYFNFENKLSIEQSRLIGPFTPIISLHYTTLKEWINKDLIVICELLEGLKKSVKNGSGYRCDNSNFEITDISGRTVLTLLPMVVHKIKSKNLYGSLRFWNYKTGTSLGGFNRNFTQQNYDKVIEWVENISENRDKCNKCGKWIPNGTGRRYSFAGMVCKACYDPQIHLPPDTRGN
jgi:hypothetical protein